MALAKDLAAGLPLDFEAGLLAGFPVDRGADLLIDLAGALLTGLPVGLVAGLVADLLADLPTALPAGWELELAGALRVGLSASEPMGPTGTESRRVGVRPALTLAFFLATGLRTGSTGLGAPSFKRTGLSPQISSRL